MCLRGNMPDTLYSWIEKFLEYLRYQRNASAHTIRNYASDLEQFYSIPDNLLRKGRSVPRPTWSRLTISPSANSSARCIRRSNKKSSVARKLATLRSFMKFLSAQGAIQANPARIVSSPKLESRLPDYMTIDAVTKLMEAPDTMHGSREA